MTTATELLDDAVGRVRESVDGVLAGADDDLLTARLDPDANSVAWLVWHLLRVLDDHVAGVAGTEQVWTANGWYERFGLPFPPEAHGYGHSSADVAQVRVPAEQLQRYGADVFAAVSTYLGAIGDDEFGRVIDENWDPPVTVGVRLVSVLADALEHVGQAEFVRGVLERR